MGTPEFAVPTLQALIAHHEVIGVVTQPDRPAGRNNVLRPSPVKQVAQAHGIPVYQPEKIRQPAALATLREWTADVYVVAAFGQILPQALLDTPPHGALNVHGSLLPRWRGAAPIHAAVRAGDRETGITIMQMDAGLDTGPMLSKRAIPIQPTDTTQTLHDALAQIGAELMIETLPGYLSGAITPQPQDERLATYAPQIRKEDGRIDWARPADEIERLVRAFTPWPSTFTYWDGRMLRILSGATDPQPAGAPGTVSVRGGRLVIGTGAGGYCPARLQLAGKNAISAEDFLRGYPQIAGATLG